MLRRAAERGGPLPDRPPSLLFVNKHYAPDVAATGQILGDLAEYLAARGHEVRVLASREGYAAGRPAAPASERRNGVDVVRTGGTAFGRGRHAGRIVDYAGYYARVLARLLVGRRYDGVVFLTTPPLLAAVGWLARTLRGQRYGVWSMDLHPDAEIAAGMLRERGLLARGLHAINSLGYRGADFVVDLGPYMRRRIVAKGVRADRTHTVHVWSAGDEIVPVARERNPLVRALGFEDRFVVMYSGNAGVVHEFGPVLRAMELLRDDPRVFFLFVGDGPQRPRIEGFARERALPNFAYLDYFPRSELRHSLPLGDVHLVSLRAEFVGVAVPSKVYGAMAAARPLVFVGPPASEPAETIARAGCGAVVDAAAPDAGERLAAVIRDLAGDPGAREALGQAGRRAFLREYDREPNCAAFAAVIDATWGARADGRAERDAGADAARPDAARRAAGGGR